GLAIERLAYKPIRRAPRLNALITAIGVSLLLQNAGQLQFPIISGVTSTTAGRVLERDDDPKRVKLDQSVELLPSAQYWLQITPAGATNAIDRKITSNAGRYDAAQPIALEQAIGKSQARDATFRLITRSTALNLPFGKMPSSVPSLIPDTILYSTTFTTTLTAADGSTAQLEKSLNVSLVHVVIVATAVSLMVALQGLIYQTRLGTAMRAVSFNPDYAALMGIPIDRVISMTFVIGAVLAAAAGFLYAQMYEQLQQTAHHSWVLLGLKAFVAAVIGGIGNVRGATVGGFLIAFIELFGGLYGTSLFANASAYVDVAVFVLLILVLLIKPSGLFGSTAQEKV
ncbi:MAG TPA: branched-chain amino acid ABC transporter permease, partial [Tepidisphaeraceae bacterium]